MLRCRDGSLYAGATVDLEKRLREHSAGRGARYTRARRPVVLVWSKPMPCWSDALREEARIKALPRNAKLLLLQETAESRDGS
ncbi:MAG: GIY-YIG nuclease family protein [Thermoanaerobaculia bacterium]